VQNGLYDRPNVILKKLSGLFPVLVANRLERGLVVEPSKRIGIKRRHYSEGVAKAFAAP
jgi:hypothetical protein